MIFQERNLGSGYGIFNFLNPHTENDRECVLIGYEEAKLNEMTDTVHFKGITVLDKKYGDFILFEEEHWYYKKLYPGPEGVYEIPYESFKKNSCCGIQDEESARLLFEVYEI